MNNNLISRDQISLSLCGLAAERLYNRCYMEQKLPNCDAASAAKGYALAMGEFSALIRIAPPAPAEIVRCKDCQFCLYNEAADTYKCRSQAGMHRFVEPTDFCSWGERVIEE